MAKTVHWPGIEIDGLVPGATTELVQGALVDYDVAAVEEVSSSHWRVFFQSSEARDRADSALRTLFGALSVRAIDVPDEDWAARSQSALRAVHVGRLTVAPPWDIPAERSPADWAGGEAGEAPITIVIQPSMGFGTGHHATTRLCLSMLQDIPLAGARVADLGTGSGVLAIAASLLGAASVIALDDDADAIESAAENLLLNPSAQVHLRVTDLRSAQAPISDVVLANLTGALLIQASRRLVECAAPRGCVIMSGFMVHEEVDVLNRFANFQLEHRMEEDEWVCVRLRQ